MSKNGTISSAGDERTRNNVMRHEYRVLTDSEKNDMLRVKDKALEFHVYITALEQISGKSRELSLAKTKIEEAVFWAVKDLTG